MQVGLLGALEVIGTDGAVGVAGGRLRHLLVRLAVDAPRAVPQRDLVDAVWPDEPPADATNALQTLVSRLRRTLGSPTTVRQSAAGYRLDVAPDDVDAHRFRLLVARSREQHRSGDPGAERVTLVEALGLWRGPALVDVEDQPWAAATIAGLEELRLDALAARVDADLAADDPGIAAALVPELEELTAAHPVREVFTGQLMRAQAAAGRVAEALATYERLRERLADGWGADPSAALQALHLEILRADPAPTRTMPSRRRTNLRSGLTTFLGREAEQARIGALLDAGRLVTVVGPGGAGKTRIASEVGAAWLADEPERARDGVWLVELAPVTDPAGLPQAFLGALDLREAHVLDRRTREALRAGAGDDLELLTTSLAGSRALLVVDNCEHLVDAAARLVETLLTAAPGLRVLATSREPLGIDGEALTPLPPLGLPPEGATTTEAEPYAAVRLFVERASAVRPGFVLDDTSVADVVEIVRRLDGLPLAIELAAARTRLLPVATVRGRLSDRFRLLTGGSRTAMPRHQTLRAVVEWSWELLTDAERLLVERLSVFPAGATLDTATTVCADDDLAADEVPDLLEALVDKSLLTVVGEAGDRFRMLETIREYGIERLVERGEATTARTRHAHCFADLVVSNAPLLRTHEQVTAITLLEAERDNVLGALRFLGESGDGEAALSLAIELSWYWSLLGNHSEATAWLGFALEAWERDGSTPGDLGVIGRATLLLNEMMGLSGIPMDDATRHMADTSVELEELAARVGHTALPNSSYMLRAGMAFFSGREDLGAEVMTAGLADDDPWVRAAMRTFRASLAENSGDVDAMREDATIALEEFSVIGDRWGLATIRSVIAQVQVLDGDLEGAIASYEAAAADMAVLGARSDEALMAMRRAGLRVRLGDEAGALADLRTFAEDDFGGYGEAFTITLLAALAVDRSRNAPEPLLDELRDLRERLGAVVDGPPPTGGIALHARALVESASTLVDLELGDVDSACSRLAASLGYCLATEDMPVISMHAVVAARCAQAVGDDEGAALLLGAGAAIRGAEDPTDTVIRRLLAELPVSLGREAFEATYGKGRGLGREEALALLEPPTPVRRVGG